MSKLVKKKRSLEFLTIFTAVVGTIIGVGIYVKNDNQPGHVLGEVGSPAIALILWAFVGLTVFMLMIFFLEITSSTIKKGNGTISNWIRLFVGRRAASAVSIYYIFVYLPINYGFFATIIVSYILQASGQELSDGEMIALYLVFGSLFIVFFSMINAFLRDFSKLFQIVGTIVKLVPIFLVLLAIALPDTTWGVFFNNDSQKVVDSNGGLTWTNSLQDIDGMRIFSGFAPILFAFNGFISAANLQSESENKAKVGRAILWGVGFSAIFYVLVTVALFLGSQDGSVVSFFEYMFNGFKSTEPSATSKGIATLMGNLVLAIVCLISINSYTLLGPSFFHNDAKEGIIFTNNKRITLVKAGLFQMVLGLFFFVVLVLLGVFAKTGPNVSVSYYFDQASNAGAIIGFTFYILLIIGGMVNRKTKKVEVVKLKTWLFWTTAIFSLVSLTFMIGYSYIDFFILSSLPGPRQDLAKPISMLASLVGVAIIWILNEIMLKKVPFNFDEANTTFPLPNRKKRFVWVKKEVKNSKIKTEKAKKAVKLAEK